MLLDSSCSLISAIRERAFEFGQVLSHLSQHGKFFSFCR